MLKPCPFCGNKPRMIEDDDACRFVICDICGISMRVDWRPEKWNVRISEPPKD